MSGDHTFILRTDPSGSGTRLAVKDIIAVRGLPMTAGSRALAGTAQPAAADAACMTGARARDVRLVGLTNLHELAFGVSGINTHFGTPLNPWDGRLVPGGSSSGSAVAVATDEADIAFGTDTTGSIRVPAACCGVAGLKTTAGRIPLDGVYPISSILDTVGPMGSSISAVTLGMALLDPRFQPLDGTDITVGRFRIPCDERIDAAIDRVLHESELSVTEIALPGWESAVEATRTIANADGWRANRDLFTRAANRMEPGTRNDLAHARTVTTAAESAARDVRDQWQQFLRTVFRSVDVIAMPTLTRFPPPLESADLLWDMLGTRPWSLAGVPALALPIPADGPLPASLQLIAPWHHEEQLLAVGALVEAAAGFAGDGR